MVSPIRVLGISGSLRKGSYNTSLLRAAAEMLPEGMTLETFDLSPIPIYNEDVRSQGFPPSVEDLRTRIAAADALLIATPEYNYSVPGVLKNAIDWASRPPDQPMNGKALAIMGASPGMLGTARAQMHLRQICVFLNLLPVNKPEVLVARAHEKIDAEGKVHDETTRKLIRELLSALADFTRKLSGSSAAT
jgi:chromate reductase